MKILHINTNDLRGGAARIPLRLMIEQNEMGYQSDILVGFKETDSIRTFSFDIENEHNKDCIKDGYQYYDLSGSFRLHENHLVQEADVIHLHNLHGGYFNPFSLSYLSHLKPIVWSLHDMHSVTGHCSYSYACNRWRSGCGNCPILDEYPRLEKDRTSDNFIEKNLIYRHSKLFIVPTAKWIGDIASNGILSGHPMEIILNGVDIDLYKPKKKKILRQKYGIPTNRIIIGAVANGGTFGQERKGGRYVQAVMDRLVEEGYDVLLVNVGGDKKGYENESLYHVGYISSEEEMAEVYNTFDIYLFPSIADTCPLVISEAMACGVPIVTFETGGIPELVQHGETGFVSPFKDVDALYEYTKRLVTSTFLREEFSKKAREYSVDHFDHKSITQQYLDVYEKSIKNFKNNKSQVLYFDRKKIPEIIKNKEEFQNVEKIKGTGFTKPLAMPQKIIIISNRQKQFSNKYLLVTFEEALLNGVENDGAVFVDREQYQMSESYFSTMLYKGISSDVLMSTVVLKKQNDKSFFKSASSILKTDGLGFAIDSSFGGILYKSSFFNEHRQAILNGEVVRCTSKEEYQTELVSIPLNDYINSKLTQSVYIYGAGMHTKELLEECPSLKSLVHAIIDRNPLLHGTKFIEHCKIVSLSEINREIPIIISSASFENDIYEQLVKDIKNPLIKIYN
ncbi:glycosyltransferase [Psychrobacillus sp. PGGUH221]|uniref:glycosyltransferase n=1 Tax=Psychrobacillus sp. PGGUH221 TaxID=3020058 RepID=UPI0035C6E19A